MDFETVAATYSRQFAQLREDMLAERLRELHGPDIRPADFEGRLHAICFPDGIWVVQLDGKPILQMAGPDMTNNMACIWRTANFRTA